MSTHGERLGRLLRLHARVSEMQTLLSLIRLDIVQELERATDEVCVDEAKAAQVVRGREDAA
jgi:hypothetical protein